MIEKIFRAGFSWLSVVVYIPCDRRTDFLKDINQSISFIRIYPAKSLFLVLFAVIQIFSAFAVSEKAAAQTSTSQGNDPYEIKSGHPRIIMTKYDELAFRFMALENDTVKRLLGELRKDADEMLKNKEIKFELDRRKTILSISREYMKRIVTLSLAYRIFEDDRYADKAIEHMMFVCEKYPDWNTQHFLDVAEMTAAVAIGYDWNFYHLTLRQKQVIRNAIVDYGLRPGLAVYEYPEKKPHVWYTMNNNWNQVCASGLIMGALAVAEDFPDMKKKIISNALDKLKSTLSLYQPDGEWFEGPAYWGYANMYLAMMMSSLNSALEHDFGISKTPGLSKTAPFYVNSVSPTGKLFNFADASSDEPSINPALFWFAKKYNEPAVSGYLKDLLSKELTPGSPEYTKGRDRLFYLCLPWFDDNPSELPVHPVAQYVKGPVDLVFFQSSNDNNALYLAAKGGKGTLSHQQLDAGTFVLDADGERWASDLGSENYFLPDFWDNGAGGGRWQYYRNTNKSHNTLVIGDSIQYPDGLAKVTKFDDNGQEPFAIIDLSPVYPESAATKRGFKLLNDHQMLVRDEIAFSAGPSTVRWGFMTDAAIDLRGDKAVLTKGGKTFYLQVISDTPLSFESMPAKSWHKETKSNAGFNLLYFTANKNLLQKQVVFSVVMGKNLENIDGNDIISLPLVDW